MSLQPSQFDITKLTAFSDAAAGHEGVLTDEKGGIVVKPCTRQELDFYEQTNANHPDFAALIPTFYGTLQLGASKQLEDTADKTQLADFQNQSVTECSKVNGTAEQPARDEGTADPLRLKGKAIDTELAIVLQNVAAGFVKPNILDVKLGAQLWDETASLHKRQKLDKVASETTSGSMGFRIAGMKLWKTDDWKTYDKFYGRQRTDENLHEAFDDFFDRSGDDPDLESFKDVFPGALEAVQEIERVVAGQESRMYSASLLFVYEGDRAARRRAIEEVARLQRDGEQEEPSAHCEESTDNEDDTDADDPKLFDVRLIDFAHASWIPGAGPDENMLQGIRNVIKILERALL